MAAQRIKSNLCKEPKGSSLAHLNQPSSKEHRPIPGWTDGIDGWRTEVYSFAKPHDHSIPVDESSDPKRAYKGFVTSSQHHGSIYSTLDAKYWQVPQPLSDKHTSILHNQAVGELYSRYNLAFARCSESHTSMCSSSSVLSIACSLPNSVVSVIEKKEVPILKGAGGKLLVPDGKLKASTVEHAEYILYTTMVL